MTDSDLPSRLASLRAAVRALPSAAPLLAEIEREYPWVTHRGYVGPDGHPPGWEVGRGVAFLAELADLQAEVARE